MDRFLKILILAVAVAFMPAPDQAFAQTKAKSSKTTNTKKTGTAARKKSGTSATKSSGSGTKKKTTSKGGSKSSSSRTKGKETSADVRKRQESTDREIQLTKEQIRENEKSVKLGLNELGKLETSIGESRRQVKATSAEVSALDGKINRLETDIADNERRLNFMRDQYRSAIKKVRASRRSNSTLAFIFSSDNFHQALRRMRYLRKFSQWKEKQSKEIAGKVEDLRRQTALLSGARTDKQAALRRQQTAQNNLETQYRRQDAIVADLRKNGQALQSHLARKQAEANQLRNHISALIAAEQREAEERERKAKAEAEEARQREEARKREEERLLAEKKEEPRQPAAAEKDVAQAATPKGKAEPEELPKSNSSKKKSHATKSDDKNYADARKRRSRKDAQSNSVPKQKETAKADSKKKSTPAKEKSGAAVAAASGKVSSFEKMRGSLPRPVSGEFNITSRFGRHALPDLPDVMYDNPGIDAEVAAGASAMAVYPGKVSGVYMIPGFSTVVIVSHGNYYTVYGNITSPGVKVGDQVSQGQALGRLAPDEDNPSKSMIHFEVWKNREKLNPSDWIR